MKEEQFCKCIRCHRVAKLGEILSVKSEAIKIKKTVETGNKDWRHGGPQIQIIEEEIPAQVEALCEECMVEVNKRAYDSEITFSSPSNQKENNL